MNATTSSASNNAKILGLPKLIIPGGTLEGLKWLALILMTLAHVDKYIFHQTLPFAFEISRITLPLFCFVLAYNLARPDSKESGRYLRTIKRLALFGLIACIFFIPLSGQLKGCFPATGFLKGAYPLNIMFMLFVAASIFYLMDSGGRLRTTAAIFLFVVGGLFVEFWWFGLAVCYFSWLYCKSPSILHLTLLIIAAALLYLVNRNCWALAALPIIFLATKVNLNIPRCKYIFYVYYPAHLAVILMIKG